MARIPLLDLGNVLVQVDFAPFLGWLAQRAGHGDGERMRPLLSSSLFYELEFGTLTWPAFARRLAAAYGTGPLAEDELAEQFCGIFPGTVPGMEEALAELAAGGPVYCLSNTNEIHLSYIRARFPSLGLFRQVFASHEMGRRKPYPEIYAEVARRLGVAPAELVFFDDAPANVHGAARAGLEAHLFQGEAHFREVTHPLHQMVPDTKVYRRSSRYST